MIPNALNKEIFFNEENHTYKDKNGQELISVTTIIKKFSNPFDPDGFIAHACAKRDGITKKEQIQIWEDNRINSSIKGKKLHSDIENYINLGIIPENENKSYVEQFAQIKFKGPLQSEVLLYNHKYGIAGTTDLVEFTSKNSCNIIDFKTNKGDKLSKKNKYNKFMLPPFEQIPDIAIFHYYIQLNLYSFMIEEFGFWTDNMILYHFNDDAGKIEKHEIPFMRKEAKQILKYTKSNPIIPQKTIDNLWDF